MTITPERAPTRYGLTFKRAHAVMFICMIMVGASFATVGAQDKDPEVSSVTGGWEAVWDFSHPTNYTLYNTTIESGQLKLSRFFEHAVDDQAAEFELGSAFNVRVAPNGTLVLPYKSSSGFTEVSAQAGVDSGKPSLSVGWGDHDNDGLQDLFVGVVGDTNLLYENDGGGTFTETAVAAGVDGAGADWNRAAIWGDYDNDGYLDLATSTTFDLILFKNNGDGTFTDVTAAANITTTHSMEGIAWTDYDSDGWLDLYMPRDGAVDSMWQNERNGTFRDMGQAANLGGASGNDAYVAVGDYNNDGWPDLLKSMEADGLTLYSNDQNGSFRVRTTERNLSGVTYTKSGLAFGDLNNDGHMDLYHADNGQDDLWINEANGFWVFNDQIGLDELRAGRGVTIADLDLDGHLDIFVANNLAEDLVWLNNGDGTFTDMATTWAMNDNGPGRGTAAADYDNDGDLDLFVAREGQSDLFYNNDHDTDNFLKFKLVGNGTGVNKAAIGARITLYEKGAPDVLHSVREITSGSGFGSTESLEQVFGVNSTKLYRAVIRFPGKKTNIEIDDLQSPAYLLVNDDGSLIDIPINGHYVSSGNFTSRAHHIGPLVSWGTLEWSGFTPTGTNIVVKTRTSPDGSSWSPWSGAYLNGDQVKSPKDAYIQYWVMLTSNKRSLTPELHNITIGYNKYVANGTAITEKHSFSPAALSMTFSSFGNSNGQTITYSYSNDGAKTWKAIPVSGDLTSEVFHNITLKAELATANEVTTPSVQHMRVFYTKNHLPFVQLVSPENEAIVAPDVTLEWNASDLDGDELTYSVYMGDSSKYPLLAGNLTDPYYQATGLEPGRTYYWYVVVTDPYRGMNISMVRAFTVNNPPDLYLIAPTDNTTLSTRRVTFEWFGSDVESKVLLYTLFLEKDGVLAKAADGINTTNITLDLENLKTYRWYVVVNDGHLTRQSEVWAFDIDAPVNNPPRITSTPSSSGQVGLLYTHKFVATDIDGDSLTFSFVAGAPVPTSMQITGDGYLTWTPTSTGIFQIGVQVSDGTDTGRLFFNVTVVSPPPNRSPVLTPIPDVTISVDHPITIDLSQYVTDDGPISEITWSLKGGNYKIFSAELNGTNLTLTAQEGQKGRTEVTAVARDRQGAVGEYGFNITVKKTGGDTPARSEVLGTLLLLLLIIVIMIVVMMLYLRSRDRKRARKKKPERIETWDEMRGELYAERRKEAMEEGPRFRGAVSGHLEAELLSDDEPDQDVYEDAYAAPAYPVVEGSYEAVYGDSKKPYPVFGASMTELEGEDEKVKEGPAATEEGPKVTKGEEEEEEEEEDEEAEEEEEEEEVEEEEDEAEKEAEDRAKRAELDQIMTRLKTEEEEAHERRIEEQEDLKELEALEEQEDLKELEEFEEQEDLKELEELERKQQELEEQGSMARISKEQELGAANEVEPARTDVREEGPQQVEPREEAPPMAEAKMVEPPTPSPPADAEKKEEGKRPSLDDILKKLKSS